jgi:rhodanese-related sulfurtransferase
MLFIALMFSFLIFVSQSMVSIGDMFFQKQLAPDPSNNLISFQTISLSQALPLFYEPGTVFLDVREKQYYDYGHIANAENLPLNQIKIISPELLNKLQTASIVIVYCNGISCGLSYFAARQLMDKGLDNIQIYTEGWPEWHKCRLPVTMSDAMKNEVTAQILNHK